MSDQDTAPHRVEGDASGSAAAPRRPGTRNPHEARRRALKVLFQADLRGSDPRALLAELAQDVAGLRLLDAVDDDAAVNENAAVDEGAAPGAVGRAGRPDPLDAYTRALVEGVADHRAAIDAELDDLAERWTVSRMPAVDRNILRLGVHELRREDTPAPVVIDEALELAREFATERTGPFVNGILEAVRRRVEEDAQ